MIQGVTSDYGKLDEKQKSSIVTLTNFNELKPGILYKINGNQLREEIKKSPKALVYQFANGCTSEYCKPLIVYENYAKKHGYKLFLVMVGYADLDKTTDQDINSPLFVIDDKYYKTRLRNKYCRFFNNELLNRPLKSKDTEYQGNLYFFNNGTLTRILREIPENNSFKDVIPKKEADVNIK
jgi:hypothetical protein